jgi:BRCA1 C Terminus (BRCT) domain
VSLLRHRKRLRPSLSPRRPACAGRLHRPKRYLGGAFCLPMCPWDACVTDLVRRSSPHFFMSADKDRVVGMISTALVFPGALAVTSVPGDLRQQISLAYPYPLAFGYSLLRSQVRAIDLYREQLRVAESMLAFFASLSLALLAETDRANLGVDLEEYWRKGITPGDWKMVAAKCSRLLGEYKQEPLAQEIAKLNVGTDKRGFGKSVAELIQAKNAFKHDRGPTTDEDLSDSTRTVNETLQACLTALGFLTAFPIREVRDIDVDRIDRAIKLVCLRYVGESVAHELEELRHPVPQPRGDLYVELAPQRWVSLYPFILAVNCTRCKAPETSFVDRWSRRDGTALLKSFERGHTQENPAVGAALNLWQGDSHMPPAEATRTESSAGAASEDSVSAAPDGGKARSTPRSVPVTAAGSPAVLAMKLADPAVSGGAGGNGAQPLAGLTIVVTGRLNRYTREEVSKRILDLGGTVSTSVARHTDYALVGEDAGSKLRRAQDLSIPILDESGFEALIQQLSRTRHD